MNSKRGALFSTLILASVLAIVAACGSDSPASDSSEPESAAAALILREDGTFTPDSFIKAGWKKSKQYDTETVPESTEIWYGFYQQKDIEIRFYGSHKDATEFGIASAKSSIEGAVKRSQGGRLLDFSGGSFTGYAEYLVVGNAVLLCEFDRTRCDELVANLE